MKDGPTLRVLIVLSTVSKHGPLTLAQITERAGFSRAAVWRALDVLRMQGWVRMRSGDNAFEVTAVHKAAIKHGHASYENAEDVGSMIQALAERFQVHVSFGGFLEDERFGLLESTNKQDYIDSDASLVNSTIILAAQLRLDVVKSIRYTRHYIEICSPSDRVFIERGYLAAKLRDFRTVGFILSKNYSELGFSLSLNGQLGFGLCLATRSQGLPEADSVLVWLDNNLDGSIMALIRA